MFIEDKLVQVIAITDTNPDAAGLVLARKYGIPAYTDTAEAIQACKDYPECIVYNLSHDESVADEVSRVFGDKRVASGPEVKLFCQMIMNLKQTKGELEKSQGQLQAVIHNVMGGIITINESGEILGFNPAAEQIFGYTQQEVLGKNARILMPEAARDEYDASVSQYLHAARGQTISLRDLEVMAVRHNGEQFPVELSASEMTLGGLRYFIGIVRDITERKLAEQKIAHLAHYDYLTDLPNRALFLDHLAHSLPLAKRRHCRVGVMFLDLDGFKQVNETLGHDAGDLLLQAVSRVLKEIIRASDTVARVGGDEFTFVLNDVGSDENAALIANKIIVALSQPLELKGQTCQIGASIGIALYPDDAQNTESLIKQADEAMYLAKTSGKNTYKFYRDVSDTRPGK